MGTDIHMVVETKVYDPDTREDLGWQLVPGPIVDCWSCRGEGVVSRTNRPHAKEEWLAEHLGKPCSRCVETPDEDEADRAYFGTRRVGRPGKIRDDWWGDRDYTVFAMLANVRNGSGFAGVRTHAPIEPISMPRGLPDDMSEEARAYFECADCHGDSWVMLEEVLRYDWNQPVHRTGVFDIHAWALYRRDGNPSQWSGEISGASVRQVDHQTMDALLPCYLAMKPDLKRTFADAHLDGVLYTTRLSWSLPLGKDCERFLSRMRELAAVVGETPTRLVFNFDS